MNQTQAMHEVTVALRSAQDTEFNRFALVLINGQIYCQPLKHVAFRGEILSEVRRYDIEHGLASQQWNFIEDKIRKLIMENRL